MYDQHYYMDLKFGLFQNNEGKADGSWSLVDKDMDKNIIFGVSTHSIITAS